MKIGGAAISNALAQSFTKVVGALRAWEQAFEQGVQVKSGTANHNGETSSLCNFCQRSTGLTGVFAGGERFAGLDNIDKVMGDACAVLARRLGGADLKVAINGDRVATDYLAGELLHEPDGKGGLAGGGGSKDNDKEGLREGGQIGRHSPSAPGYGPAEADESDDQNYQCNRQQANQLDALARLLALIPVCGLGQRIAGWRLLDGHSAILRAKSLDIALGGVVVEVKSQREVRTMKFAGQGREGIGGGDSAPGRAVEGDVA